MHLLLLNVVDRRRSFLDAIVVVGAGAGAGAFFSSYLVGFPTSFLSTLVNLWLSLNFNWNWKFCAHWKACELLFSFEHSGRGWFRWTLTCSYTIFVGLLTGHSTVIIIIANQQQHHHHHECHRHLVIKWFSFFFWLQCGCTSLQLRQPLTDRHWSGGQWLD